MIALGAFVYLSLSSTRLIPAGAVTGTRSAPVAAKHVRLIAVGDINLGRAVGKAILGGDTLYPFAAVQDSFAGYDLVFGNLESSLSDQGGETEKPGSNMVFTGPPGGAESLRQGGVTMVSIANNHALDYGPAALRQTMQYLDAAGVRYAGSSLEKSKICSPLILERSGIRIALFACTDLMNGSDSSWKSVVAAADTGELLPALRHVRDSVDFIIVSYHGGTEYAEKPAERTEQFAAEVIRNGADLFLGHHPHVSYGVDSIDGKLVVPSLGNFVFRQPDRYWTQRSFAFEAEIVKDSTGTRIAGYRCAPVFAGFQPTFALPKGDVEAIQRRIALRSHRGDMERSTW